MKKTTIKDIAHRLEVSPSTISRALSNHPDISEALKIKIKEVAQAMKYRPSAAALHLKRGSNKTIALIIPQITSFFYPSVIHGIEAVLHSQGYTLMILPTNDSLEREEENIGIAYDHDVAGVLIALTKETVNLDHFQTLKDSNIPVVLIDKVIEGTPYSSITIDDYKVSYQMVQHLYKTGCQKIIGIFGKASLTISHLRYRGFAQALADLNLPHETSQIAFVNSSSEAYTIALDMIQHHHPDGLYVMTDEIMLGVMPAIAELDLKVPEEISVLAISDGHLAQFMIPTVSHMKHDGLELGSLSAQKIIQYINAKNNNLLWNTPERIQMNTNIVFLNSTK